MNKYFEELNKKLEKTYRIAEEARKKGYDPEKKVEIHLARNMAERVEGLISSVTPQLVGSGVIKRIEELENQLGRQSWEVALSIALEVAQEKFCKFKSKKEAMEIGIRTGFAYHTIGIVSAPLEGIVDLKIKKRKDGKEYIAVNYASPIRGAGGTAAAFSLILCDYIRKNFGYDVYDPDEKEINRAYIELQDYHERVTNLQYNPSEEEIKFLVSKLPIEIDGEPTEDIEVSNYKDLPRVATNKIRGGFCLVLSMMALKAPKLWKEIKKIGTKKGLEHWSFLEEFIKIQKEQKSKIKLSKEEKIAPDFTYVSDLVAGRPILSYPMANGGFRLRYGRCRVSGYSAAAINPALMWILNKFIATGTQLKTERPGKAAAVTICDTIEGPIVKLFNKSVVRINSEEEAKKYFSQIKEILYLGDILINYGDFSDRAHVLVPAGYCEEWWAQELEKATVNIFGNIDFEKLSTIVDIAPTQLEDFVKNPLIKKPSIKQAINLSTQLKIPLHPKYTFYWRSITIQELINFLEWLNTAVIQKSDSVEKIILLEKKEKRILELLGVPHQVSADNVVIEGESASALLVNLGIEKEEDLLRLIDEAKKVMNKENTDIISFINENSKIKIKDKLGTVIGARMGRPEKSKQRKLKGAPHSLFPCGSEGGRLRSFQSATEVGKITAEFPIYICDKCNQKTIFSVCEKCSNITKRVYVCKICGYTEKICDHNPLPFIKQTIDIKRIFDDIAKNFSILTFPDLIKGVRGTNNKEHIPEHLIKGILRAKHNLYVNKDGTVRYDMTELPITHFKPSEIGTSIEKLKELGYTKDVEGRPLEDENQLIELKPQDIILPDCPESPDEKASEVLIRIANFVDDLLVTVYKVKTFYNVKTKEDLIGHLVIGLAPHISAGVVGRIIGFSKTQGCFAHPLWHAAVRRDCDGDEACIILLLDGLLNFSRHYLPDKRGSRTMDAPLVLTATINPAEVDDMVHKLDVVWRYPLEFYEATHQLKMPSEVLIEQLGSRLVKENHGAGG